MELVYWELLRSDKRPLRPFGNLQKVDLLLREEQPGLVHSALSRSESSADALGRQFRSELRPAGSTKTNCAGLSLQHAL